jgi:tetratricopeptide (TPR) repeat protein
MNHLKKLVATLCAVAICTSVLAQPAKPKAPVKAKPAATAAKIDYEKLKKEIRSLYRDEKHAEVIKKSTQYLLKFPKDTQVVIQKAVSHISLKQYPAGFDILKQFYSNPDTAAKYIAFLSFSVPEADLLTSGITCTDEAIRIAPNSPYGYFAKGGIYSDQRDHEKALPLMEKANTLYRNDEEQKQFGPFYAKELAFNKQQEKAIAAIDLLYKKFPKDREIIYSYASIYRIDKNYNKALEKIEELVTLYPDDMDYRIQKVALLTLSDKNVDACTEVESIIAKDAAYDFLTYRYKCADYFATPAIADIKTATWEVNSGGNTYDFIVSDVKGSIDSGVAFDWAMNNDGDMKGHIAITKEAMEKAVEQNNYFGPSLKNATLSDKTTVWLSKAVINGLQKDGKIKMDVGMGNGEEVFTVVPDNIDLRDEEPFDEKISIKTASKYLNTLHIKNEDGSRQLWILNDAANPMVVKMDIGFTITLKSVE